MLVGCKENPIYYVNVAFSGYASIKAESGF